MPDAHPQYTVTARNLSLRPTQWGILFGFITIALLLISIHYNISLGYYLSFLMMGLSMIALIHTWQNISHLEIDTTLLTPPVFLGETTFARIKIHNTKPFPRYAINIEYPTYAVIDDDIIANGDTLYSVPIKATERGWLHLPKFNIFSEFPLGLFRISAIFDSTTSVLVYPRPLPSKPEETQATSSDSMVNLSDLQRINKGSDEFNGHRAYQTNDPIQRIDWKASSRNDTLLTKAFMANQAQSVWLDWRRTEGLPYEDRISRLTYAVTAAHNSQQPYGLKLPTVVFSPNLGFNHYHQCLQALALM